ncbi:MAG: hypothetical protein ACRCX2_36315 [Paraclostridium sp.]
MKKINTTLVENIETVLKVIPVDHEEYTSSGHQPPLKKFIKSLIQVDKFKTRESFDEKIVPMAIKDKKSLEEEYCNKTYDKLDDEEKTIVKTLIVDTYDYKNSNLAYARNLLQAEKVSGLMKISGKDVSDYEDINELFQDREAWSKFSEKDVQNFPQFITQTEMFKDNVASMNNSFFKKVISMMSDMSSDEIEVMSTLLHMSDMAVELMNITTNLSDLSSKFSDIKEGSFKDIDNDEMDDEDREEMLLEEIEENVSKVLRELGVKKKSAAETAEEIVESLEDEKIKVKYLDNINYLLTGKLIALYKDKGEIVKSMGAMMEYIDPDLTGSEKSEASKKILPLLYIAVLLEENLGDIIPLDEIDKDIVDHKVDKNFDWDDVEDVIDDLDSAIAMDYATGLNVATFNYGVTNGEDFYKDLARKTIPKMSYEYFENQSESSYDSTVNLKSITKVIQNQQRAYSERSDLIHEAASAILSVIKED